MSKKQKIEVPREAKDINIFYVKTPFNNKTFTRFSEYNNGVSTTIPDLAYTVEEIIQKFTRGITLDIYNEPYYSDSDDLDDIDNYNISDLTDIPDYVRYREEKEMKIRSKNEADTTGKSKVTEEAKRSDNDEGKKLPVEAELSK